MMKEMKIQNTNKQISKRHKRKYAYWKRTAALFMALLMFFTADSSIMGLFTVLAEEGKQTDCVITAFSLLSEEIAEQIVAFGTPMEELKLPDALEVVCTYEQKEENTSEESSGANEAGQEESDETVADETDESGNSAELEDPDKKDDTEENNSDTGNTIEDGSSETNDNVNDGIDNDSPETDDNADHNSNDSSTETDNNAEAGKDSSSYETDNNADGVTEDHSTVTGDITNEVFDTIESSKGQSRLSKMTNRIGNAVATVKEIVVAAVMTGERKLMSLGVFKNHVDSVNSEIDSTNKNAADKTFIDITNKTLIDVADETLIDIADISDSGQSETEKGSETESGVRSELGKMTSTVNIEVASWDCTPEYDSTTEGNYVFTPILSEAFTLAEGISLPEIIVVVEPELQEIEENDDAKTVGQMNRSSVSVPFAAAKAAELSGSCGDNVTYTLTDSNGDDKYDTLTISGTGKMADYSSSPAPWGTYASGITSVTIESGVTSIGEYAFYKCSALKTVTLSDSIESIGESAFYRCSSLTEITIPDKVNSIEKSVFSGCSSLETITIPSSVTSIGSFAFSDCSALTLVEIPNTVTYITAYAFSGCSNMILYYASKSSVQNILAAIAGTKANVAYTIEGGAKLEIVKVGTDTTEIDFPAHVGGAPISSSNWKDYPTIKIKHTGSKHNILNGVCAICGYQEAPKIEIDYVQELLTGFAGGKTYQVEGKEMNAPADAASGKTWTVKIDETWFGTTIKILAKGNGAGQSDSEEQKLKIPARPSAPAKLSATSVSYNAADDGTISGVDTSMQYKKTGVDKWENVKGNPITGLAAGEYEVRFAAVSGKSFASLSAKITVEEYVAKKEETPKAKIDYLNESLTGLIPNADYLIGGTVIGETEVTADQSGEVPIPDSWMDDKSHTIVKVGNNSTTVKSDAQRLTIPKRPNAPTGITVKNEAEEGKGGSLTGLKSIMEYRKMDADSWIEITKTSITGLEPGIYEIRFKSTSKAFASKIVEKSIAAATMAQEATPNVMIEYLSDSLTNLVEKADYLINGEPFTAGTDGKIEIDQRWFGSTIDIVKAGNGATTMDSDSQMLDIPLRPDAPTGVGSEPESDINKKDGKLTGVNNKMQYWTGNEKWTAIKDSTVTGLSPGIYEVRYKATSTAFSSESVTVIIQGRELVPENTPDAAIDFYDENFIYLDPYSSYLINGKEKQTDEAGIIPLQSGWMKGKEVSIVKKGDTVATKNSEAQKIVVPTRRSAPSGIKTTAESAEDAKDGILTGVSEEMQYRKSGSNEDWIWISGDRIEELEPGKYEIRYAATYESFASSAVTKKIYAYGEEIEKASERAGDSSIEEDSPEDNGNSENGSAPDNTPPSGLNEEENAQPQSSEEPEEEQKAGAKLRLKKTESDASDNDDTEQEEEEEEPIQWELMLEDNQTIDLPEGDNVITIPAKIENDRIVSLTAGRTQAGATENGNQIVVLLVEQGAVIVTVNNIEEDLCSARVADSVAVANAVLNGQEAAQVAKGEIAEIRIDVKRIDDSVSQADKQLIEQGMEFYQKEFSDLQMGMYMDISVFACTGEGKWKTVEVTSELVEIIINIPDTLKTFSANFYTMRAHEGEYYLLEDMDDITETITIQTHLFSTYAVIYQLIDVAENAENSTAAMRMIQWLSNYGLILLVFLLVEIIIFLLVMLYLQHKKKAEKEILT